jgi:hypothetical protein
LAEAEGVIEIAVITARRNTNALFIAKTYLELTGFCLRRI